MVKQVPPSLYTKSYNCPRCGVLCPQTHHVLSKDNEFDVLEVTVKTAKPAILKGPGAFVPNENGEFEVVFPLKSWDLWVSICNECDKYTVWENDRMIFPFQYELPQPIEGMPNDVKEIYEEAASIFNHSPRAAAALVRLGVEKLIPQLPGFSINPKQNINEMIGSLVKQGIPEHIQQGLDSIRLYGNQGAHPGEIDLNDNSETVEYLFELLNIMVEELITRNQKISTFFSKLPEGKRDSILRRDTKQNT